MNRRQLLTILLLLTSIPPLTQAEEPSVLTLDDAYCLALQRSETIAISAESIKEAEGRFLQALSGALPRASFQLSEKRQDGTGASAFTLKEVPERKFVFSQPLFSGFKEFAAMAGSRAERRQRRREQARAQQLLRADVANAYYLLIEQREKLATLETIRIALQERLEELAQRERLGRARPSERVSAEAHLRRTIADTETVQSQETVARQLLEFLIGRPITEDVRDLEEELPEVGDEAAYLEKAASRPDVLAAQDAWQVARKEVSVARADLWPDVDLESTYYTERVGAAAAVDWDVMVTVDVPLFQGGQTIGAIRETSAKARQAKLTYERTQREAIRESRDTYAQFRAAVARAHALEQALASVEENYRLQREDYRLNLVSNLDVLRALQELEEARQDLIGVRYEAKRLYWLLRVAAGDA
jgi:outer membrane protein